MLRIRRVIQLLFIFAPLGVLLLFLGVSLLLLPSLARTCCSLPFLPPLLRLPLTSAWAGSKRVDNGVRSIINAASTVILVT
eukprot:m.32741 g.32741  ORF g.32741 m.32741 type:complete len:81 (+) comp5031_c0_seq1:866-1108(+)